MWKRGKNKEMQNSLDNEFWDLAETNKQKKS